MKVLFFLKILMQLGFCILSEWSSRLNHAFHFTFFSVDFCMKNGAFLLNLEHNMYLDNKKT